MAPVEIYTQRYCSYCQDAKDLLSAKGVASTRSTPADRDKRGEMIERRDGRTTLPQIFIGATHVGGCDELYALDEAGKLDPLLVRPGERKEQA